MNIKFIETGFKLGLITKEELVSLAEDKILEENYEDIFIEISSLTPSSSTEKFLKILEKFSSKISEDQFFKFHLTFLCYLKREFKDWHKLQSRLVDYYYDYSLRLNEDDFEFWSRLKDDLQLREDGFSGCMKMPLELDEYFDKHSICSCNGRLLKHLSSSIFT